MNTAIALPKRMLPLRVSGPRFDRIDALAGLERLLEADADSMALLFARACCLEDVGRPLEAERAYLQLLERDPEHFGALTNLGSMLFVDGRLEIARAFYSKAVVAHPDDAMGYVNLGNVLFELGDADAARSAFTEAVRLRAGHPVAHFALSMLAAEAGDADLALRHRQLAFAQPLIDCAPYHGVLPSLDVLLAVSANGGNLVTHLFLDTRAVRVYSIVAEAYRDDMELPPHHVFFNGIGDADRSADALSSAERIARRTAAPVLNAPAAVAATGREAIGARLAAIDGVVAPATVRFARAALDAAALERAGLRFPVLVRAPGFHTGQHFELVHDADALATALAALPGDDVFAIAFHDVRGADGAFRKYRVLGVGGRLLPVHLAISGAWKVHYFSSDMAISDAHRAEEAAFLADPAAALGPGVIARLERVLGALGLDYGGIDFGIDRAGNIVVFEANATMAVYPPPADDRFAYRRPAAEAARDAVLSLLRERAAM